MTEPDFRTFLRKYKVPIREIREAAHLLHDNVNQTYDRIRPYGYHLDMVVDVVYKYGHWVCAEERDVLPLFFGAYYHDSIEDARQTYHDVNKAAKQWMDDEQALMATEIVYALTNDKGRTREERAGEKYYQGIRETPYAPFVKLCDRVANFTYSFARSNAANKNMKELYLAELPHFLNGINAHKEDDIRFSLPIELVKKLEELKD